MPRIELQGLTQTVIVTQLDRISVRRVLRNELSFSGKVSGIDGLEYQGKKIVFPPRYLLHVQCIPRDVSYPVYVSTSGTVLRYMKWPRDTLTYREDYTDYVDNALVVHDSMLKSIMLAGSGEILAKMDPTSKFEPHILLDTGRTQRDECKVKFEGCLSQEGAVGEVMELDGAFKIKPINGTAKRQSGKPYRLRGDWEAVLNGHVVAEVGSVSIYRKLSRRWAKKDEYEITPSFVKIHAQGELVI